MAGLKLILSLVVAGMTACSHRPSWQGQSATQAQQPLSWEEHTRRYPDTYIETVDRNLALAKQRLEQAGLAADLAAVRAAVDHYLPSGNYTLQATGATAAILRRQRVDTVTQFLVSLGYGAHDVSDPKRAARLVETAARAFGSAETGDAAWLSPTVALAEFIDVVTGQPRADGLSFSSLRYRVIEPLKNSPPAGTLIVVPGGPVHYPDGTRSMSTADMESMRPGRYVLFLSQRKLTAISVEPVPAMSYGRVFGLMRELNGKFVPVSESAIPEVTLDELRAFIRDQLCSEDHVLAQGVGVPLQC